jgi:ABC-type uncharacterized transport system ATPase subunit
LNATVVLELRNIRKQFGQLLANDNISMSLNQGELLALLGENGAGKTTLMNIVFGHYTADSGRVFAFGKELPPGSPSAAIAAGIGMVHQHFALAANLTVLDNIILGTEPLSRLTSDRSSARAKIAALSNKFGLIVDPDARVADLSIGERQRVEILKPLYRGVKILILDEPTAVLTPIESEQLFATLRLMAREGLSLIFISHKLAEVLRTADRIVVLRAGKLVAQRLPIATDRAELAELMVGHRIARPRREPQPLGATVLEARFVDVMERGRKGLSSINFTLKAGEVLAIVGVAGNGQGALGRLLTGLAWPSGGEFEVFGAMVSHIMPKSLVAANVGRVPEDRLTLGVVGEMSIWENAIIERLRSSEFSRYGFVRKKAAVNFAAHLIARFDVRDATPSTQARLLSGGNMQKLILGRSLMYAPRILIANQPTRGLDEGAISAVHAEILSTKKAGAGVVLISEDLEEVLEIADRVQAIYKGSLSASIAIEAADARRLGLMMAGVWDGVENAA